MKEIVILVCVPLLLSGLVSILLIYKDRIKYKKLYLAKPKIQLIAVRPRKVSDLNHRLFNINELMVISDHDNNFMTTWTALMSESLKANMHN